MNELIESIINKEYTKADNLFNEALNAIVVRKLNEAKKMYTAKMFSEQVTVNNMGRVPTSVGTEPRSYYVQRKGLAEGDVVPLGDKFETDSYHIHVGSKEDSPVVITHKDTGITRKVPGGRARVGIYRNAEKGLNDKHIEDILYGTEGNAKKPETMKEEAKKAALSIVSKRAETSDEKRKRFLAALEGPGSSGKQKPSMKVVKEQVPSPEDSAKVGRMTQQASDSGKIENIIKRDEDSRAVGELAKQKVEPKQPSGPPPMSKMNERPGVVGSGRTHGSHQHPKFRN
mgnify:CR=1 FL=1